MTVDFLYNTEKWIFSKQHLFKREIFTDTLSKKHF